MDPLNTDMVIHMIMDTDIRMIMMHTHMRTTSMEQVRAMLSATNLHIRIRTMLILAVMGIITDRQSPICEMYNMYNDYAGLFTLETSNTISHSQPSISSISFAQ